MGRENSGPSKDFRGTVSERFTRGYITGLHPNDCWEWIKSKTPAGYGCIYNGKLEPAHRVSYKLYKGEPSDLWVLHKCDNPGCVNPEHLFLGTVKDNVKDMHLKGRANKRNNFSWKQIQWIRDNQTKYTKQELAEKTGMTSTNVYYILKGLTRTGELETLHEQKPGPK